MINKLSSHLFYKVALLVLVFSILQIVLIFYVVDHYYTDQDTIWDAHELYSYSSMVQNWSFPSDTLTIQRDIDNLHLSLSVYSIENKSLVWSHPTMVDPGGYIIFADSDYLSERHDIVFPLQASFGENDQGDHLTRVDRGGLVYFFKLDKLDSGYSSEYINYVPPLVLLILFMLGLNYFIQYLLTPIKLMKQRIKSLRVGDLESKIEIISNDELSELSSAINKMTSDLRLLLSQKEQLLLDVSHELKSPLARMRLLVEMIPNHKNQKKLISEIIFLEGMVSNLLMSDKLSMPYSNIEYKETKPIHLCTKALDLVGFGAERIKITDHVKDKTCFVDETKMLIAIKNILDNAIKYSFPEETILLSINLNSNFILFTITSNGQPISEDEKDKIFNPFFRSKNIKSNTTGFGLGLTICKKIIDAHNGQIAINLNNNNTSFTISVPINGGQ